MRLQLLATGLVLFALSSLALADNPSTGYRVTSRDIPPVPFAAYGTLNDGNRVVFDGESCDLYDPSGSVLQSLGSTGAGFAFSSFVIIDPSETFAIVGESQNHGLFKVDLVTGLLSPLTTIVFNFAAVFESPNTIIVSAATCGFNCGNDIIRVDTDTGVQTLLGHVPGPSGPVAVDSNGAIYYGTQSGGFPPLPNSSQIVMWTEFQIEMGAIDDSNWSVFASNLDAASSLAIDPANDHVYLAESVFGRAQNYIVEFSELGLPLNRVLSSANTQVSSIEILSTGDGGAFRPYDESPSNVLSYHSTDFAGIDEINRIESQRISIELGGLGVTSKGRFQVRIAGAPSYGVVSLWRDAQTQLLTQERSIDLGLGQPIFSDLSKRALTNASGAPNAYNFDGLTLTADKYGNASVILYNDGRLTGLFAYQAFVRSSTLSPIGTSNTVLH